MEPSGIRRLAEVTNLVTHDETDSKRERQSHFSSGATNMAPGSIVGPQLLTERP